MVFLHIMRRFCFILALLAFVFPVSAGPQASLVVAVDSSRSLKSSDISAIHDGLSRGLDGVPSEIPVGLVTFDDTARWLIEPTNDRTRVLEALKAVEPSGTTTVLYDGIFLAAQAMGGGGAVLVISDGRDENSAVTVTDIEGLCIRKEIQLLTVGVGRTIDDKVLRRLALLTRGVYLGDSVADLHSKLQGAVEESVHFSPPMLQPPSADETAQTDDQSTPVVTPPRTATPQTSRISFSWQTLLLLGVVAVFLLIGAGILWWIFSRPKAGHCAECGAKLPDDGGACLECQFDAIRTSAETKEVADEQATRVPDLGVGAMAFETRPDSVDQTVALGEVAVLTVHEEGRENREYTLPRDRIFAVGRAPKVNTLQVRDQTISAQHFKIVFKDSNFYVVDLWTTNGTSVNHECVRVHPLTPGDVIRAGLTEFVFSSQGMTAHPDGSAEAPPTG